MDVSDSKGGAGVFYEGEVIGWERFDVQWFRRGSRRGNGVRAEDRRGDRDYLRLLG